jgi:hypothetical protein
MRYHDVARLLFEFPPDILSDFTVIVDKQDTQHLFYICGTLKGAASSHLKIIPPDLMELLGHDDKF